jgi:hypothetical protein
VIQKVKKVNFGGRSNKVAECMTDNDHVETREKIPGISVNQDI